MKREARRAYVLCGPIGSGKSTVGEMLRARGAVVIDADRVGHQVIEPGGDAFPSVVARWPNVVDEGRIDRARLAEIVFSDAAELAALEAITHPAIGTVVEARAAAEADRVVVVEVPLLKDVVGAGWPRVVVDAPTGIRIDRLLARGHDRLDIERRMSAQPPREDWLAAADHVIDNSSSLTDLALAVDELWAMLQRPGFLVTPAE